MAHPRLSAFPDSWVERAALQLLTDTAPRWHVHHCLRSFRFGESLADVDGVAYDREILLVAAALHDHGLLSAYDTGAAYELDGGTAVRAFAAEIGWPVGSSEPAAVAVERHMAPELTRYDGPEVRLLWDATGVDVTGWRAGDLDGGLIDEVLKEHPRVGFAAEFGAALADQAARKPASRAAQMARDEGILDRIASCAFDRPPWVATPRAR